MASVNFYGNYSLPQGNMTFKSKNYSQHLPEIENAIKKIAAIEKKPPIERTLSEKELLKKFEKIVKLFKEFRDKCKSEPLNLEIGERFKDLFK